MIKNKKAEFDMIVAILIFLLMLYIAIFAVIAYKKVTTDYKMPNGVICKDIIYGKTKTFTKCSDNQKYINPEYYKEIKK